MWPLAAIGGLIVGYAVADFVSAGDGRRPNVGVALVGGTFAWTVQIYIQAGESPYRDFLSDAPSGIGLGFVLTAFVVGLIELGVRFNERRTY